MARPSRPGPVSRVRVHDYRAGSPGPLPPRDDRLATEEPLEIRLGWPGRPPGRLSITMRTPGHDFELAAGFLRAEGVVREASDFNTIAYCTDHTITATQQYNVVTAQLAGAPRRVPAGRHASAGSACGVCGTQSIDEVLASVPDTDLRLRWDGAQVSADVLLALPEALRDSQPVFARTGGLHAAGLFDATGALILAREDVGRHNAVDKVVGACLLSGDIEPTSDEPQVLCLSGRVGFELVQKAIAAQLAVVAAVGAPSSLAVSLAAEAGLCVVGFVRDGRFVVYSAPERVRG